VTFTTRDQSIWYTSQAAGLGVRRQDSQIDVTHNNVYDFGRIGIYTRDDNILNTDGGVIHGNTVTGLGGLVSSRLSYGISVYSGNPTVDGNDISGCISGAGVAAWASSAIDVWTGSTSALTNNYMHDCDNGSSRTAPRRRCRGTRSRTLPETKCAGLLRQGKPDAALG